MAYTAPCRAGRTVSRWIEETTTTAQLQPQPLSARWILPARPSCGGRHPADRPERDRAVARVDAAAPGELFDFWSVDRVATAGPPSELAGPDEGTDVAGRAVQDPCGLANTDGVLV